MSYLIPISERLATMAILLSVVVVLILPSSSNYSHQVFGASDFHPSSSSSPTYLFRETIINANTNSTASYDDVVQQPLWSSCSNAYQQPYIVSTQAMMCSGGGGGGNIDGTPRNPSTVYNLRNNDDYGERIESDIEEDYDDEDDDDDDGHSSMLSTASLRKSRSFSISRAAVSSGGAIVETSTTGMYYSSFGDGSPYSRNGNNKRHGWFAAAFSSARKPSRSIQRHAVLCSLRGGDAAAGAAAATSAASSQLVKNLINSAIVTLVFEACMGHIMEFLKIAMQTSPKGTTYAKVYKDITSEKGIAGLWDGFMPWGVIQAVLKGGVFGLAYAVANSSLMPLADQGIIPKKLAQTLAGGIAGGFQGYVLSPTLLMKTRVMTNEVFRESMTLFETTWKSLVIGGDIIKKEGLGSLMKGANTFAMKRVFDWSTRYYFADLFESIFFTIKGSALTVSEKSTASLLGGVASTVLTLPLDVLVAKTQDAKKAGVKVSPFKMFSDELQEEGWSGLKDNYMRGFEARLAHVCLTTVVMKTVAPIMYGILFKEK